MNVSFTVTKIIAEKMRGDEVYTRRRQDEKKNEKKRLSRLYKTAFQACTCMYI